MGGAGHGGGARGWGGEPGGRRPVASGNQRAALGCSRGPRAQEARTQGDRTDGAVGEVAGLGSLGWRRLMSLTGPGPAASLLGHRARRFLLGHR